MKNQREPNDGKEAMREHGKYVKMMLSCKNNVFWFVCFLNIEPMYFPAGRC